MYRFLFLPYVFLLCAVFSFSKPLEAAEPEVRSVDFYPVGARFTFQIEADKADKEFEFELPGAFNADTVRFLKREDVAFVRVESVPREEWVPSTLTGLKSQIERQNRDLKLLRMHQAAIHQTVDRINGPLPRDFSGKDLILYIEDSRTTLSRLGAELVDLDIEVEKSGKELQALQAEYQRRTPSDAKRVVRVSGAATVSSLAFEVFTRAAGWSVQYDMNLDSATGDIDAKMRARAWQKTGIDAKGEFNFHTRQPSFAIAPAEVFPLTVDLSRRPEPVAFRSQESKSAPSMKMEMAYPLPAAPAQAVPDVVSTLVDVSVRGIGDLKGDGTPEDVELGRFGLKSAPLLISIPEQNREAWIVASMDILPESLLPGTAELSVDGAITGRSNIPGFGTGQMSLPFGMAARLTSKKTPLVSKTGSSWLGKGILEDGYTLEITNGMETECEVLVKDRVPIPVNDKIAIEVAKIDPAPNERDEGNLLTWKVRVNPGETKKIVVEYRLRYPGDEKLEYR